MRSTKARWLWVLLLLAALSGLCFAQPTEPLHAELEPLPANVAGGDLRVDLSAEFSSVPAGGHIQYRRVSVAPATGYDDTTAWLPVADTHHNFEGAEDSVYVVYQVRAAFESDTSEWSTPQYVLHDLNPPSQVERLEADWCASGEGHIRLTWNRAFDSASGVDHYRIYRRDGGSIYDLRYIDDTEFDLVYASVDADGRSFYTYEDHAVDAGHTYHYAVVAVDKVWQWFTLAVPTTQLAGGPDECIPEPPYAPLRSIEEYLEAENIEIEVNTDLVTPRASWQIKYMVKWTVYGDLTEYVDSTDWAYAFTHNFDLDECCTYTFHAKARDLLTGLESGWSHLAGDISTTRDIYGPDWGPDSMWIDPDMEGLKVYFTATAPESSDCGAGWRDYVLYRIPFEDYRIELIRDAEAAAPYVLDTFTDIAGHYQYWDDIVGVDPVMDLEDRVNYFYWVMAFDNLGHYLRPAMVIYDTATVDKGIKAPILEAMPDWTPGDSITVHIIDSSFCDMSEIQIMYDYGHTFTSPRSDILYTDLLDPVFTYDAPRDCFEANHFSITYPGLIETQVCFKARAYDALGNESEWSNVVCTQLDNTPPTMVHIDSIQTYADSTHHVKVRLVWRGASDARIGMQGYKVYRSSDPASPLGELLADLPAYARTFVDHDPIIDDNFRNNYYTIISYDRLGHEYIGDGLHTIGFFDETPPYPVTIDDVYLDIRGAEINVIVEFSDDLRPAGYGSPLLNEFRLEHANTEEWLWFGDPELITIEEDHASAYPARFELPYSALAGAPTRYFQIAAIDMEGNESGYSAIYEYVRDAVEDTVWVHLTAGWNLFSLPVYPGNYRTDFVLPGVESVSEYDPDIRDYETPTFFEVGKGYWVLALRDMDIPVVGVPIENYATTLTPAGWHIVGATFNTTDYGYEGTLASGGPQGFNPVTQNYEPADSLKQAQGYFLMSMSDTCQFFAPSTAEHKSAIYRAEAEQIVEIKLSNTSYILGYDRNAEAGLDRFDSPMPPAAPNQRITSAPVSAEGYNMLTDVRPVSEWDIMVEEAVNMSWSGTELVIDGAVYDGSHSVYLQPGLHKIAREIVKVDDFQITGAYPNPFNAKVEIDFELPEEGEARIEIFDMNGKVVWEKAEIYETSGQKTITWDGTNTSGASLGSGVYFCRVSYSDKQANVRLLYVR